VLIFASHLIRSTRRTLYEKTWFWLKFINILRILSLRRDSISFKIGGLHSANFCVASYHSFQANLVRKNVVLIKVNINNITPFISVSNCINILRMLYLDGIVSVLKTIGGLHSANFCVASYHSFQANLVRKNVVNILRILSLRRDSIRFKNHWQIAQC